LGVYCLFLINWKKPAKAISHFAISGALAMSATSFYWLRVMTETDWVKHSTQEYFGHGFYDYRKHLFPIIYSYGEWYWQRLLWLLDITTIATILFLLPLAICVFLRTNGDDARQRKLLWATLATGVFVVFMVSVPSLFIWNAVETLQKLQFPWRFLAVATLISTMAFTLWFSILNSRYQKLKKVIGYGALTLILATILLDITQTILPAAPLPRTKFQETIENMRDEEGCSCWWPVWADQKAFAQKERVNAGPRNAIISSWDREKRTFSVDEGNAGTAEIATFYYPYWKAKVNGSPVEIAKGDSGTIVIPLSPSHSDVVLEFREPPLLETAKIVSMVTWIGLLGAALFYLVRRRISGIQYAEVG
jgi:hypothetical protein